MAYFLNATSDYITFLNNLSKCNIEGVFLPCRDRPSNSNLYKSDEEEAMEGEGDNFWYLGLLGFILLKAPFIFFLQAKVWLNTKQIIAKVKRVFVNMSKRQMF